MNKLTSVIFVAFLACCQSASGKENKAQNVQAIYTQIDTYVADIMKRQGIVGLNYAILINHRLVHQQSMGLANLDLQVPMTIDKLFAVASISKLFSSTALNKLLKQYHHNVDETLGVLLPERTDLPTSWRALTLKQLLSHTSGVPDQIDYQIYLAPQSDEYVINALRDKPFAFAPSDAVRYNATGFLLLRLVIEKLSGQRFEQLMQEHYFNPLHLTTATYGGFKKTIPNRVTSYRMVEDELELFPLNYSPTMYAGAGLNINMNDLILWIQAVLGAKILSREDLANVWQPVTLANGEPGFFGLGWETYRLKHGIWMTGHGGAGISSVRHYWKESSAETITVILLTNGARSWTQSPDDINMRIANYLMPGVTD